MHLLKHTLLACTTGAMLALPIDLALAESTYGYAASPFATDVSVSATARVKMTVDIPLVALLRVGSAGAAIDEVKLVAGSLSIPGGPATPTPGNSQPSTWNGQPPTFTVGTSTNSTLSAYAWHNALGGGVLSCSTDTQGLLPTDISVTAVAGLATKLSHPGNDIACGGTTSVAHNTVYDASWTYAVSSATLSTMAGGSKAQATVTYQLTTL
jgi:hypothetical protein